MKRALVTGGRGGIGAAISQRLARDGMHVLVHANRGRASGEQVVQQILQNGGSAELVLFDVTDPVATAMAVESMLAGGPVQVVINNAGIHSDAPMAGMTVTQWSDVVNVSLNGFFNVTQPLLLPMLRTRWGRIVSVSSVAAVLGNRGQTNYAAAKSGLHGASKSLAHECASRGVTVNVVAPGVIATPMAATFPKEQIDAIVPAKRAGTPDEVAALVAFLVSEDAGYITGQIISINGGMA